MDNASAAILGQLFGAAVAVSVGALVVQFTTEKIANFKPPYGTTFLASLVIGFFVQAAFYSFMLKSPDGVILGYGRACIVSIIQLVVAALIIGVIMMMLAGAGARG